MYVTPERFRTMGFGADLDDIEDVALRGLLVRASAKVDAYCSIPLRPSRFSFLGGTVVGEEHRYDVGHDLRAPQREFFLKRRPVRDVTGLRIYLTNTHYINIATSDMFVRKNGVEIVSIALTANAIFGTVISPVVGLRAPVVKIDYEYGHLFAMVDEALQPTDARTFRAPDQFWSSDTVVVKVGGVTVSTGFTIDRLEGAIVFETAPAIDAVVTASYTARLPREVSEATAIIAAADIGERELVAKGMAGVRSLKVGEITIERDAARRGESRGNLVAIPGDAALLLDGLKHISFGVA